MTSAVIFPLTQGKFTVIDREDLEKVKQFKWYFSRDSKYPDKIKCVTTHAQFINGKIIPIPSRKVLDLIRKNNRTQLGRFSKISQIKSRNLYLHRYLLNPKVEEVVDHINGNPLDNRKENLRLCTQMQNVWNSRIKSSNTTGFKGVGFRKNTNRIKKYYAKIKVNKKVIYLGGYLTAKEASEAYKKAAKKYFGEFKNYG